MIDYRLTYDVLPDRSNYEIEVLILSRRDVDKWKVMISDRKSNSKPDLATKGKRITNLR